MKIKKLLLICMVLIMTGCSFFHREHTLGNKPLVIPTHAGYAKNDGDRRITIFNLDNNEIVGNVSYIYKDEFMAEGDFYVDNDGKIYITMQLTGMNSVGHTIRIIDPSTGLEEGEIDVNTAPNKMFDLGNNRILVTSNMILYGDSVVRNVVVDLNQRKVVGNLYTKGLINDFQRSGDDTFDIMIYGLGSLGVLKDDKEYMARYCPASDSVISEYREIDNEGIGEPCNFIISNGYYYIYTCRNISLYNMNTLKRESIITTFPSTHGIAKMIKVNDKIYIAWSRSHYNGNDVDSVIVIDDNTHQVIKEIRIPYGGPSDIKYSTYKNRIYITNSYGETIVEVNPETDLVTDTIRTEDESQGDGFNDLRIRE